MTVAADAETAATVDRTPTTPDTLFAAARRVRELGMYAERVGVPLLPWQQRSLDHISIHSHIGGAR